VDQSACESPAFEGRFPQASRYAAAARGVGVGRKAKHIDSPAKWSPCGSHDDVRRVVVVDEDVLVEDGGDAVIDLGSDDCTDEFLTAFFASASANFGFSAHSSFFFLRSARCLNQVGLTSLPPRCQDLGRRLAHRPSCVKAVVIAGRRWQ